MCGSNKKQQKKKEEKNMSRPKGAKNKPKVCMVNLSDLISKLNPDTQIPVDIKFAQSVLVAQAPALVPAPAVAPLNMTVTETGKAPVTVEEIKPTVMVEEDTTAPAVEPAAAIATEAPAVTETVAAP